LRDQAGDKHGDHVSTSTWEITQAPSREKEIKTTEEEKPDQLLFPFTGHVLSFLDSAPSQVVPVIGKIPVVG
jgi:hypothetical protein